MPRVPHGRVPGVNLGMGGTSLFPTPTGLWKVTNPTGDGPSETLLGTGIRLGPPPAQQGGVGNRRQPRGDTSGTREEPSAALPHGDRRAAPRPLPTPPRRAPSRSGRPRPSLPAAVPCQTAPCPVPSRARRGAHLLAARRAVPSPVVPCRTEPYRAVPCRGGAGLCRGRAGRGGAAPTPAPCGAPGAGGGAVGFGDGGQGKAGPAPVTAGFQAGGPDRFPRSTSVTFFSGTRRLPRGCFPPRLLPPQTPLEGCVQAVPGSRFKGDVFHPANRTDLPSELCAARSHPLGALLRHSPGQGSAPGPHPPGLCSPRRVAPAAIGLSLPALRKPGSAVGCEPYPTAPSSVPEAPSRFRHELAPAASSRGLSPLPLRPGCHPNGDRGPPRRPPPTQR